LHFLTKNHDKQIRLLLLPGRRERSKVYLKFDQWMDRWLLPVACNTTAYGCCPNGVDPALGPDLAGCDSVSPSDCAATHYGCCLDGTSTATGPNFAGCLSTVSSNKSETGCSTSAYGCCKDGETAAYGPHSAGCPERIKHGGNSLVGVTFSRLSCQDQQMLISYHHHYHHHILYFMLTKCSK